MNASSTDVAIIGAGPNGLGLASHLKKSGVEHRIFGLPMKTWRDMPKNMYLKSLGFATSIPTPAGHPTFPEYCRENGLEDYEPIEFQTFADYGEKFQRDNVPYVEQTLVTDVRQAPGGFQLTLQTGERLFAKRVVVAVGQTYFPRIPEEFASLPEDRVSHTWGKKDFTKFACKDVAVIGGGSSALETAALLHEHGARVRVLVRKEVYWGGHGLREWERSLIDRVRVPISTIGHGRENWVLQHVPWLMHYVPASKRIPFTRKHLGPAPAWWLRDRVDGKFPVQLKTSVTNVVLRDDKIALQICDGEGRTAEVLVDHIMAGTGYEVDVDRMTFINRDVAMRVRRWDGKAPRLSRHFQSSIPGLYFVGPVAALSFGPLVRFVAGSYFAVPVLARHLSHKPLPVLTLVRRLIGAPAEPAPAFISN